MLQTAPTGAGQQCCKQLLQELFVALLTCIQQPFVLKPIKIALNFHPVSGMELVFASLRNQNDPNTQVVLNQCVTKRM